MENAKQVDLLTKAAFTRLVKGANREDLRQELLTRYSAAEAQIIIDRANGEYDKLVQSGQLQEYEYDLTFKSPRRFTSKKELIGIGVIVLGIGAAISSYHLEASGGVYTIDLGTIILGFLLLFSD